MNESKIRNTIAESGLDYFDRKLYKRELKHRVTAWIKAQDGKKNKGAFARIAREIYSELEKHSQKVTTRSCTNNAVATPTASSAAGGHHGDFVADYGKSPTKISFGTSAGNIISHEKPKVELVELCCWEAMETSIMRDLETLAKEERMKREAAVAELMTTFKGLQEKLTCDAANNGRTHNDGHPSICDGNHKQVSSYQRLKDKHIPCGKNYKTYMDHHGHIVYRRFIQQNREPYQKLQSTEAKNVFAKNIRLSLELNGYIFLRQRSDKWWEKIEEEKNLRDKVTKPLRESTTTATTISVPNAGVVLTVPPQGVNGERAGVQDLPMDERDASTATVLTTTSELQQQQQKQQQQYGEILADAQRIDLDGNQGTAVLALVTTPVAKKQKRNQGLRHDLAGNRKKVLQSNTHTSFAAVFDNNNQAQSSNILNTGVGSEEGVLYGQIDTAPATTAPSQEQTKPAAIVCMEHPLQSIDPRTLCIVRLEVNGTPMGYIHFPSGHLPISQSQPTIRASVVTTAIVKEVPTVPEHSNTCANEPIEDEKTEVGHHGFASPNSTSSSNLLDNIANYSNAAHAGCSSLAVFDSSVFRKSQKLNSEDVQEPNEEVESTTLENENGSIDSPSNDPINNTNHDCRVFDRNGLVAISPLDNKVATGETNLFDLESPLQENTCGAASVSGVVGQGSDYEPNDDNKEEGTAPSLLDDFNLFDEPDELDDLFPHWFVGLWADDIEMAMIEKEDIDLPIQGCNR